MTVDGPPVIKTVKVFNKGLLDLVINSVEITGALVFRQTNDCGTVRAGETCTVSVINQLATGLGRGGKLSALLVISSDDPRKPNLNIKLTARIKKPKWDPGWDWDFDF